MHSLAYCFAAKRKCFQEEVNVFAEYGVLNYWTYLVGAIFIVLVPGPNTLLCLKIAWDAGLKEDILPHVACLSVMRY